MSEPVTRDSLAAGLGALGLRAGDRAMVHSSLKSLGQVEGGALAVIGALQDVLTEEGLLLMPSFNHGAPFHAGGVGYFDPRETPTENGLIPETFRALPGVWRSLNPTHAYCAWGRDAERYLNRHHLTLTMGPDSPQGILCREGGLCLFLGTDYFTNTFKHVVEMSTGAPCLGRRTLELPVHLPDGRAVKLRTWGYRGARCPISDPHEYADREMERRGLHRRAQIGRSTVTLLRLTDFFQLLAGMLREGYAGHPPCHECPVRPNPTPFDVPSDWDDGANDLLPDSPSRALGPLAWHNSG
ncbi:MAG: AAC(3) family N-acetyltransferase [Armatimonadetes bacterium]|nr:AAC(3) family N-acetyltransferase [Armatimonadota bacterium]